MRDFLAITSALADENRVRAVLALRRGELCVCQVTELLGLAPSTVSKHLSILSTAGLVEGRKRGRWIFYRLPTNPPEPVRQALAWAAEALGKDARTKADAKRLGQILKEDPEVICKRQLERSKCCSSAPATPAAAR